MHSENWSRHKLMPRFVSQPFFFFFLLNCSQFIFNYCTEAASVEDALFASRAPAQETAGRVACLAFSRVKPFLNKKWFFYTVIPILTLTALSPAQVPLLCQERDTPREASSSLKVQAGQAWSNLG